MLLLQRIVAKFFGRTLPVDGAHCANCGENLVYRAWFRSKIKSPCPACGSNLKIYEKLIVATFSVGAWVEGKTTKKVRSGKRNRPAQEFEQGDSFYDKWRRWSRLERLYDRENDRYYEHIEDAKTGWVHEHKDESLREHRANRERRQPSRWYRLRYFLRRLRYFVTRSLRRF